MVWGAAASAASYIAAAEAHRKAGENALNMLANMYGLTKQDTKPYMASPTIAPIYPKECPSCHSHEFRMHHGRWVCSFCRSSA